jgi:hypothetical protein
MREESIIPSYQYVQAGCVAIYICIYIYIYLILVVLEKVQNLLLPRTGLIALFFLLWLYNIGKVIRVNFETSVTKFKFFSTF